MVNNFKMVDSYFDKEKDKWFITLEEGGIFGIGTKLVDYVNSTYLYKFNNFRKFVFYNYPEMERLTNDNKNDFLNRCLRKIIFEKSGKII